MKNAADLLSATEGPLLSCEKTYGALENDLSQRLSKIIPTSSRQTPHQLQGFLDTIRKRRQNAASLHDKVTCYHHQRLAYRTWGGASDNASY